MIPHSSLTVAIKTFGCKLNQFEGEQIRAQLIALGCFIVPFDSPADVYVINTCTVTGRTDRDCRRLIRQTHRQYPHALIAVTGCYAEADPEGLKALPEAHLIIGNTGKADLPALIMQRLGLPSELPQDVPVLAPAYGDAGIMLEEFSEHTRAFVKVQEGCDAHCTYCIIPQVRGTSRSVPPEIVQEQVERLIAAGHPEIVLIGIHLGKYGEDLPGAPDLTGLMLQLLQLPGMGRIRLSSIEPMEVPQSMIELITSHPQVCRHLHIPAQSGCDAILKRMGRPYDIASYTRLVENIMNHNPATCIGSDIMVGFPGETAWEFEETRKFIADLPFGHLHVFSYSQRPGTPAATMPGQVLPQIKQERNQILRDLAEQKRIAFAKSLVGQTAQAVIERPHVSEPGWLDGLTDNYFHIRVAGGPEHVGCLRNIRITATQGERLSGELISE